GFQELTRMGLTTLLPRLAAVQVDHFNTFDLALRAGIETWEKAITLLDDDKETTICAKIAHKKPPDGREAFAAVRASGGCAVTVTDQEAFDGVRAIAQADGVFVEPSSAVVWPALRKLEETG